MEPTRLLDREAARLIRKRWADHGSTHGTELTREAEHVKRNWFWLWIGGSITRVAGTGLVLGLFIVAYGATPGQAVADLLKRLPPEVASPWARLALVVVGLAVIGASLHLNVWSLRQKAIDEMAEDLSWAIHNLLNRAVSDEAGLAKWEQDYHAWCQRVSKKLENRAFFTRADQLHFDRLGFVPATHLAGTFNQRHSWLASQLSLKFERLRDIINWTQMRGR